MDYSRILKDLFHDGKGVPGSRLFERNPESNKMLNKQQLNDTENGGNVAGSALDVTQGMAGTEQENGPGQLIRVLLADDHALVREGTRRLLETESDVEVVAEAASGEEAIAAAQELHPDVAIIDIAMPGMGGIEATRAIKKCCPETAVLVLSAYDDEPYLIALLEAGAAGFLLKNVHGQELVNAIRSVSRGEAVLKPILAEKMMRRLSERPQSLTRRPAELLSEREFDVLKLAARGLPNKEIARRMGLSIRTIHSHLANIFTKMQVGSRTEAVLLALRQGMISLQDTYDS